MCHQNFLGTEILEAELRGADIHAIGENMRIFILLLFGLIPTCAFGQGLEIQSKVGGFSVSTQKTTVTREGSEFSIKATEPFRISEALAFTERSRQERNSELIFTLNKMVEQVVASQHHCGCHKKCCHTCSVPGPIPAGLGVQCWLNTSRTSFLDQFGRRWHWCRKECVWVDP